MFNLLENIIKDHINVEKLFLMSNYFQPNFKSFTIII